ncbi:MAG: type I secretion system permease/ATPase [Pseudomonadota bacterium]
MKTPKKTDSELAFEKSVRPLRTGFIWTGFFSAFVNLLMLVSPIFMMQMFDRVLASGRVETLLLLTLVALVAFIVYGILEWVRGRILARVGAWLEDTLAQPTLLAALAARLRGTPGTGQAVRDLQQVRTFLSAPTLFPFFDAPWTPIFLAALWLLHPYVGAFATIMAAILFVIGLIGELSTRKHQARAQERMLVAQQQVDAAIDQSEAITALGMRQPLSQRWNAARSEASILQRGLNERGAMITGTAKGLRQMVQIGILALGAWLVLQGQLTPGGMIAASILLGRALAPIDQSITAWRGFSTARLAWRRLKKMLSEAPNTKDLLPLPDPRGRIEAKQVGYRPASATTVDSFLLHGVSFAVEPGEALGIVGPSGAGKSTLCRVVAGLYPPTLGMVTLDGASLDQWDPDRLGAHLGYLPQDVGLPPATVAETISRLGEANSEEVINAAMLAGAHELIVSLPAGYETPIGAGGIPLSGGQRQRIGLARALFGEPAVVILDEAAAHLDQEGEQALQRAILSLKERKATVLMIAHRPSLVRHMDKLLVLQDGRVTKFGGRDEVLAAITPAAVPLRTGARA